EGASRTPPHRAPALCYGRPPLRGEIRGSVFVPEGPPSGAQGGSPVAPQYVWSHTMQYRWAGLPAFTRPRGGRASGRFAAAVGAAGCGGAGGAGGFAAGVGFGGTGGITGFDPTGGGAGGFGGMGGATGRVAAGVGGAGFGGAGGAGGFGAGG